jgi:hypothetical protein
VRRLARIELPGNKKRASDSFESLDARAALPQNCSPRNVSLWPIFVNGPDGLELPTNVPSWLPLAKPQLLSAPGQQSAVGCCGFLGDDIEDPVYRVRALHTIAPGPRITSMRSMSSSGVLDIPVNACKERRVAEALAITKDDIAEINGGIGEGHQQGPELRQD